jgi:hypothetical protein
LTRIAWRVEREVRVSWYHGRLARVFGRLEGFDWCDWIAEPTSQAEIRRSKRIGRERLRTAAAKR